MSIKIGKKEYKLRSGGLPAGLLVLYFLGTTILGVSLVVPYAFLWLMWTLNGIKENGKIQKETLAKLREQIEAREDGVHHLGHIHVS